MKSNKSVVITLGFPAKQRESWGNWLNDLGKTTDSPPRLTKFGVIQIEQYIESA